MKKGYTKLSGVERRNLLLQWLKDSGEPITGSMLAEQTDVSRQVIVQDISLLRARNEPIISTARGYLYMRNDDDNRKPRRIISCAHRPDQTEHELMLIVGHDVTVVDVKIEHAIYGVLTGHLMLRTKEDVQQFIQRVTTTKASLLSDLTDGSHFHTIEAETVDQLDLVCNALKQAGYLVSNNY